MIKGKINHYNIMHTLGSGAFSKVKLAVDTRTGQQYAIKILKGEINEETMRAINVELSAMQILTRHQNIL